MWVKWWIMYSLKKAFFEFKYHFQKNCFNSTILYTLVPVLYIYFIVSIKQAN